MKIRKKLIIGFLIIALVPICMLAILDYSFMHRTLTDRANQELLADARLLAKDIDKLVETNLDEVRSEAQLPDFSAFLDLPPKERHLKTDIHRHILANLTALSLKNQIFIRSYALLDRNGLNIVDTYSPKVGADESRWEYFKAPMRDLIPHVSLNFRPRLREEEGGLFFSAAVFNVNKEVVGILRVHYNAFILQREVAQYINQKPKETVAVLLDENHIRIAHSSKPERIFKSVVPLTPDRVTELQQIGRLPHVSLSEMATDMVDLEKAITNAHSQPFLSFQESMADGQKQYAAIGVTLDTLPWVLVFAKPYTTFLAPVNVQIQQTLILMSIVIGIVVSGAFLASRYLAAPLTRLTSVANKVAKGDLQARTDIRSHDEIGELGSSFDHMADRIQSTLEDLRREIAERERLNTILETTSDLVSKALPNTQMTYMNRAGRKLIGWSADEDPQTKRIQDIHPEWANKILKGEGIPTAIRSGVWEGETALFGPDGTEIPVSQVLMSHKSPNGELEYLSTIMRDITDRKRAEQTLRQSKQELAFINRIADIFLTIPDEEAYGEVLLVVLEAMNSKYGVFGYISEDGGLVCPSMTRDIWEECQIPDKDIVFPRASWGGIWGRALTEKKTRYSNHSLSVPAGHIPILKALAVPVIHQRDAIGLFLVGNKTTDYGEKDIQLLESISTYVAPVLSARLQRDSQERERKLAEEELRKYRDHLEEIVTERTRELKEKALELEKANISLQEADRLKSVFLASMSHELRTPLNSIIGFTGIILQGITGEINEEQKKQLSMVKNSGNHLLSLINELLDIAKIEAGRVELSLEEFSIDEIVREVTQTCSPIVKEKGLELTTDVPEDINLSSDRRRMKQILINFVSNAVKFTDRGSVKIRAIISEDENLQMSVTDTGIGIEGEDMDKLFQPFQQVDSSLAKQHEGTGLGLHLTRKLADLLGGSVSATSAFGKGSEFTLRVPITPKVQGG